MPNPRTIQKLIEMEPCPFEDGQMVTISSLENHKDMMGKEIWNYSWYTPKPFKMPDGYYHLPPDKQLGLPLGLWHTIQLKPLIDVLPYGVIEKYTNGDTSIINCPYGQDYRVTNYNLVSTHNRVAILKQPPNLYNPLDHKEEVPTVEVPVEPERVSVQEFAKNPAGKWVNTSDGCPIKGWYQIQKEGEDVMGLPFKLWDIAKKDHPIYATDPTAWLASQAEQEGNHIYKQDIDIASNDETPREILEILARHCEKDVRYAITLNPNTPHRTLVNMAKEDADEDIRRASENSLFNRSVGEYFAYLKRMDAYND